MEEEIEKKDVKKLLDYFKKKPSELDQEIEVVINELRRMPDVTSDGYKIYLDRLNYLIDLRDKINGTKKKRSVSPDTIAVCACNLLGIALVLGYEHYHPITSKAFGWILKGRV